LVGTHHVDAIARAGAMAFAMHAPEGSFRRMSSQ